MRDKAKTTQIMLEKSTKLFLHAIREYNNPTNDLRVDGFLFFMCAAWEMLFKALLLSKNQPIFYNDKRNGGRGRTLSVLDSMKKCMTDSGDPLRKNIETLIGMRNSAQHFIVPEYASFLNPIFLANVVGYCEKLQDYFGKTIDSALTSSYAALFVPEAGVDLARASLEGKYGREVAGEIIKKCDYVRHLYDENSKSGSVNPRFALQVEIKAKMVKDSSKADLILAKGTPNSADAVEVKIPTDVSSLFPLSHKNVIEKVRKRLAELNMSFTPPSTHSSSQFNNHTLQIYIKGTNVKGDSSLCYAHLSEGKVVMYTYSYRLVEEIVTAISNDPEVFKKLCS